jgi:predicted RNA-binding Zn-ribbon protein involved in translation (DUF1610 family)
MEFELIIIILVLFGFSYYFKNIFFPKAKGAYGEYIVARKLKRLAKKEYIVLNNILLKNNNSTTQIDHIVICKSGIIVIETKNYSGWIHGHEKSEYWTQTIYKHKSKLKNPIKQNWIHVYAIKKLLAEYNYIKYLPIVVFSGNGKLKNITSELPVIYTNRLLKTIKEFNKCELMTYSQMESISLKLNSLNLTGRKENRKHKKLVKQKIREQRKNERHKVCPKCGNKLIKRNGKYGRFYGCSNFPKCKFTLNIN